MIVPIWVENRAGIIEKPFIVFYVFLFENLCFSVRKRMFFLCETKVFGVENVE